jgi:hypothetical protein
MFFKIKCFMSVHTHFLFNVFKKKDTRVWLFFVFISGERMEKYIFAIFFQSWELLELNLESFAISNIVLLFITLLRTNNMLKSAKNRFSTCNRFIRFKLRISTRIKASNRSLIVFGDHSRSYIYKRLVRLLELSPEYGRAMIFIFFYNKFTLPDKRFKYILVCCLLLLYTNSVFIYLLSESNNVKTVLYVAWQKLACSPLTHKFNTM